MQLSVLTTTEITGLFFVNKVMILTMMTHDVTGGELKTSKPGLQNIKKSDCITSYNWELVLICQCFHLRLNHLLLPQNKYHTSQTDSSDHSSEERM